MVKANRSLARRRPSTTKDQAVNPTTKSRAAISSDVAHPVQSNSQRRPSASTAAPTPAATGAHLGNRAPISADGAVRLGVGPRVPTLRALMPAPGSYLADVRPAI